MSSVASRVAALSAEQRRMLAQKLAAKKQSSRLQAAPRRSGAAPLSYAQQRLWFLQQLDPNSTQYNLPAAVRIEGPLDVAVLERTFSEIVRRHEALRTRFTVVKGLPAQVIEEASRFLLPVTDVRDDMEVALRIEADSAAPFDLEHGPLFRAQLLRKSQREHVLLLNAHHIVADNWSFAVLVNEILALYDAYASGRAPSLSEPAMQYADFAVWQRDPVQERAIKDDLLYWRDRLAPPLPVLEMPVDRPRTAQASRRGAIRKRELSAAIANGARALSTETGATLFMTLLAAFDAVVARYTGQEDIIVGSPVSGRERIETHGVIGCFVNTIALRTDCSGDPTFRLLLERVRETCLSAYAHQDAPFERVVEAVQPDRDLNRTPIFQVAFGLRQDPVRQYALGSTRFEMLETHTGMSKFDLMFELIESGDRLTAAVEYSTDLFDEETIDRLLGHYQTLLGGAVASPDTPITLLPMLTPAERSQIEARNRTEKEYPLDRCLHELIEEQVDRTPDATALIFEDERVTYRELDRRSNQLAHRLRRLGAGPDDLVGVAMERSIELVVSLIAVMKAGAAYVPIDPEYPADRIAFMLADANPRVLLTQRRIAGALPACDARIVAVDELDLSGAPQERPALTVTPRNLAYMIYTSGSTGRPKGALNSHRGIVNRLCWMQDEYRIGPDDRVLQKTPFSFDVSVWEFFWPLMTGATLVVARPGGHRDAAYLADLIASEGITTLHFVPSMLQIFLEEPRAAGRLSVRRVICSGEALPFELQQRFFARMKAELHNLYGPTEAAVDVTYWRCDPDSALRTVPIGRPIANIQIHLLDSRMNPVPVGVAGELYIGGVGVGLGYLNRPELTAEKFIADPFRQDPEARLYRTGDLARWLPDGAIDYLGRIDHQVKIRGFRIELGEIEAALNQQPAVRESVVAAVTGPNGDKRLAAYVTPSGAAPVSVDELRARLAESLPEYMIPAAFTVMDALPLSPNGKVDRRALPTPDFTSVKAAGEMTAPRTPTEELLAELWSAILDAPRIGARDDFFRLGGHSLLAAQMASRVRTAFGVELPVRMVFEHPTLEALAADIDSRRRTAASPAIARRGATQNGPLSFAQQRLWILDQLAAGNPVYHLPIVLRLAGELDRAALASALNDIVARHEALRTTFPVVHGSPAQHVAHEFETPLAERAVRDESELSEALLEIVREPFDLATGPLFRAHLLRLAAGDHVLAIVMHHIVSDGWSLGVFLRELSAAYDARSQGQAPHFAELPVQYADYAAWQREWLESAVFAEQMEYWRRQLDGLPVLNLPTDRPRPRVQTFRGGRRRAEVPADTAAALRALAREQGATFFMVLFAGFQALMSRYSGQTDIAAGAPVANRNRPEIEGLIGFFVNTLVLRTRLDGDPAFSEIVARVRRTCLDAYANSHLPFERLVEELRPDRRLSANPLFQVAFTLRDNSAAAVDMPGLSVRLLDPPEGIAKFDLTMEIVMDGSGFAVEVEYDAALFDAETIDGLIRCYRTLLEGAAANPSTPLSRLPLLDEEERRRILVEWNNTATAYPRDASVAALFEEQARKTPRAPAVEFGPDRWTYQELDRRANQVAHRLLAQGAGKGDVIALSMERSAATVAAMLGILKAGCAYAPLDVSYPAERLKFMLEDAGARIVVTELDVAGEREDAPRVESCGSDLAYVMYTSGSTGKPKGIAVRQRGIVRLVRNTDYIQLGATDRIGQISNISFDAATFEIWGALLNGGCLVGISKDVVLTPDEFAATIREQRITTMFLTSALFHQMARQAPDAFRTVRNLLVGGDVMDASAVRRVERHGAPERLLNAYGPTETTTFAACHLVRQLPETATTVPIGRPISNTTFYVLDRNGEPAPVGVPGELYIGGDGVARGYWNRPELTAAKFVSNPFSASQEDLLYRTGDLVRYRRDGAVEFLGRLDHQVKIRGFRIELEEIEQALAQHPAVREALVIAREDAPGDKRLVAYVVGPAAEGCAALRAWAAERLPEYMVPSAFVALNAFPLNVNGKVDRAALPAPEGERTEAAEAFVEPSTPLEKTLAEIWSAVLGVAPVGVSDNFFALGGHSLLATQAVSRIKEALGVEASLRLLFEAQTIAELALRLQSAGAEATTARLRPRPDRESPAPVSFAQQRLWFLDQLMPGNVLYNMPAAVRLRGALDIAALERAINATVERHEALRTTFHVEDGVAVQVISPRAHIEMCRINLRGMLPEEREQEAGRLAAEEASKPFDLAAGPLLRITLIDLEPAEHVLLVTMHHIIADGWSIGVFVREIAAHYQGCPVAPLPVQYADYSVWQREWIRRGALDPQLSWWKEQLSGELPVLDLPADHPRPATPTFRGGRCRRMLRSELLSALREVGRERGATLFMTLLAAYQTLLYRYTGQEDVIVGSPIAGRNRAEVEDLIGFFVNTLPLRSRLDGAASFSALLERVRETTLGAYANQDVPFEMLVDAIAPERDRSRNPLFQVAFVLQNAPAPALELPGLAVEITESDSGAAKFDLTLVAQETAGGLSLSFEYAADLFEASTIEWMARRFEVLLEALAADPDRALGELPVMSDEERRVALARSHGERVEFRSDCCLHELFEEQAARTPDAEAVVFGDIVVTYAELNRRSNRIAAALRRMGAGPEALVAVAFDRSPEMIAAVLGVLKAGGAYLPVAVDQPKERIAFLLKDACPRVVIGRAGFGPLDPRAQWLDIDDAAITTESGENAPNGAAPGNLAYVIYTSGSTGRPKGVMVEHRGVCNLVAAQGRLFGVEAGVRVLQFAAPTFDAAVSEIFVTLLNGGVLHLARKEQLAGAELARLLREQRINVVTLPPSVLATVPEEPLPALATLVVAGEACAPELARRWSAGRRFINAYGPTEATVCATAGECDGDSPMTIGAPIGNVSVFVVDDRMQLVPDGVAGELVIGGVGVARGYLQRPELNQERFVQAQAFGARVYRTGDRGRRLPDGRIEYLGRLDRQVKIRGFRIEPGEIEAALVQIPGVREAAVIDREDGRGKRRLIGYVSGSGINSSDLRAALQAKLPDYMIPGAFVVMNALPLTPHGKLDRAALPAPGAERREAGRAPANAVEETLAEIWRQVLAVTHVGVEDNFFELGGDSILTIQVVARANQRGLRLTPRDLFDHQTIASLAKVAESAPAIVCEQGAVSGRAPLTPIQHWFFEQELRDAHHWNQAVLLELAEPPDVAALDGALAALVEHHDALRLRFERTESGWVQEFVAPGCVLPLKCVSVSSAAEMERMATEAQSGFDLATAPLMRAVLFDLGAEGWRLLIAAHHLVVDGVSWRILLEDLHAAYDQLRRGESLRLPRKTTSFREWAQGLERHAIESGAAEELPYWLGVTQGETAALPVDHEAGLDANTREHSAAVSIALGEQETATLLREAPKAYRAQINDLLLAALAEAFALWTRGESILVDLESHGREALGNAVDVSRTVGWFTSVYPVRMPLSGGLGAVKEQLRRVPRNGAGYGLLRYLAPREMGGKLAAVAPLVSFNYLGQFDQNFAQATAFCMANESSGAALSPLGGRRHLLEFNGNVSGGQLHFTCVYSRRVHERATIERLLNDFSAALRALIRDCVSPEAGGFTPSDFPLARLDEKKLGKLAKLMARPAQAKGKAA
jgi:amino acid adenylation domain-containing protein/non-ribosomal peptide synthase protein (TIGR01720 family)